MLADKERGIRLSRGKRELCKDCSALTYCAFRNQLTRPIRSCDHYLEDTAEKVGFSRDNVTTVRMDGLCTTCSISQTCPRSSIEGGVWHCEDYL